MHQKSRTRKISHAMKNVWISQNFAIFKIAKIYETRNGKLLLSVRNPTEFSHTPMIYIYNCSSDQQLKKIIKSYFWREISWAFSHYLELIFNLNFQLILSQTTNLFQNYELYPVNWCDGSWQKRKMKQAKHSIPISPSHKQH